MDNDYTQIVDNVADRIGLAIEQVQPIAETLVRETQILGVAHASLGLVILVCAAWMACYTYRFATKKEDRNGDADILAVIPGMAALLIGAVGLIVVSEGLSMWFAPTLHILGKVL